jgi:DMSO/TMAO reductase YedYZ heme-binding membrane subunit
MFMAAFTHYLAMKVIPVIQYKLPVYLPLYQAIGVLAIILTLLMFLTSNNWATHKLKGDWKRLHRATYLIGWLIFGHIILQDVSWQSITIGVVMVLEVASLIKAKVNVLS